jgi:hypothetical protein
MPSVETLRARAAEHARQLESVFFVKASDLAARWNVDVEEGVLSIPRAELPYLEHGKSKSRRYDPRDVEAYEQRAKKGEAAA